MDAFAINIPLVAPDEQFVTCARKHNDHISVAAFDAESFKALVENNMCATHMRLRSHFSAKWPPESITYYYCVLEHPDMRHYSRLNIETVNSFKMQLNSCHRHDSPMYVFKIVNGVVKPLTIEDYTYAYRGRAFPSSKICIGMADEHDPFKPGEDAGEDIKLVDNEDAGDDDADAE
jgi:hypothetical protein